MLKTLKRKEVVDSIEGKKCPSHVPMTFGIWPPNYRDFRFFQAIACHVRFPGDLFVTYSASYIAQMARGQGVVMFDRKKNKGALDSAVALEDYKDLDKFLTTWHNPNKIKFSKMQSRDRYKLAVIWNFLYENLWQIRGMDKALTDLCLYPEEVHKIFRNIIDFYKVLIKNAKDSGCDGFLVSDDLGHQNNTFFSPDTFKNLFFPYYKEFIDYAHSIGMHVWLHTCGNVTNFLPFFVEMKLDVLHPLQKYCMDEVKVFNEYKDKISFLYGFDVQQIIPNGTTDEIKAEVRRVYDLFSKANGRFIFTAGNGITANCPIESYKTLVKEAKTYNPYSE